MDGLKKGWMTMNKSLETLMNQILVINEAAALNKELPEAHFEIFSSESAHVWMFNQDTTLNERIIDTRDVNLKDLKDSIEFLKKYHTDALNYIKFSNAMNIIKDSVDFAVSCNISQEIWEQAFKEAIKSFEEVEK